MRFRRSLNFDYVFYLSDGIIMKKHQLLAHNQYTLEKMSFNLKQYDVGMVTMKYNFDGVGQSIIIIIVFFFSSNNSRSGIFLMQLHVELDIVNELCTLHHFLTEFLSRMNNVFANEKKMRFLLLQKLLIMVFCMPNLRTMLLCKNDLVRF